MAASCCGNPFSSAGTELKSDEAVYKITSSATKYLHRSSRKYTEYTGVQFNLRNLNIGEQIAP